MMRESIRSFLQSLALVTALLSVGFIQTGCSDSDDVVTLAGPFACNGIAAVRMIAVGTTDPGNTCMVTTNVPAGATCAICSVRVSNGSAASVEFVGTAAAPVQGVNDVAASQAVVDRALLNTDCNTIGSTTGAVTVDVYEDPDGIPDNGNRGSRICRTTIPYSYTLTP